MIWAEGRTWGVAMRLVQPPGHRSCVVGGHWSGCKDCDTDQEFWIAEWREVLAGCLNEADRTLLIAEMRTLMRAAERGDLTFGRDAHVDQMEVAQTVLEMRLETFPVLDAGPRHVRLYFTEPDDEPELLLAAKLGWKQPGPI